MIRTGALSARQKQQVIDKMRAHANAQQQQRLDQVLAEEYTIPKGTIYNSNYRKGVQSHEGETKISGRTGDKWVGHTTQKYPDGFRVSHDNPKGVGSHWTNENLDKTHPDYHKAPSDVNPGHEGEDKRNIDIDDEGNLVK